MGRSFGARGGRTAALTVALVLSSVAGAKASGAREPMVVVVEGARADAVSGWIADRLNAPDTLEEEQAFRGELRARGALPLHLAVANPARDARLIACAHAAAGGTDVARALLVDVQKTSSATRIHVWSLDARPGGAMVERDITLPAAASVIEESRAILATVPAPVAPVAEAPKTVEPVARPPAPSSRAPVVETERAPDRIASAPPPEGGAQLLSIEAALGVGTRRFSYVDRVTSSLRPYSLGGAPMASVAGAIYPLAFTRVAFVRDFGVTGDYARAFAFSSEDSTGARVDTTWQSFDVGGTERIRLSRALLANVSVGYGENDFQFNQSLAGAAAALPSVAYRFVRAGADLRATVSAFSFFGGGSYLDLLSTGYTSQLFPRQSVGGVEGHLGASYALARRFEVSIGATYARVFYSFNPVPGNADVAGGALDEQTRVLAGLSYVM
jgi:hypothetical protein